mgnify:CR=1 FL=1
MPRVNKSPLSMRQGKIIIDGDVVAEASKYTLRFTPTVWEGKTLSEQGTNRRWLGYDVTGTIERWKTNKLLKEKIKIFLETGETPEMTIQGIAEDPNSDFFADNGNANDEITAVGCVLTGDLTLMDLDTDGEVVKESISFGAKSVSF